jgi:integrase
LDVAHRVLIAAGQVWCYAVATGRTSRDITADIRGALRPHHGKHFAAITDPAKLGEMIRVIRTYQGGPIVRAALQLALQRPGELRAAEWAEFYLDGAMWTIPAARMKRTVDGKRNCDPHQVPLPTQAHDRASSKADKLRDRLGWEADILKGNGCKPKGMHWSTFARLQAQHDALFNRSFVGIMTKFGPLRDLMGLD